MWKRIGDPFPRGYEISTEAVVRSVNRVVPAKYTQEGKRSSRYIKGCVLTPVLWPDGTPCVNLWRGGNYEQIPIRRLMLLTFKGPYPRNLPVGMDAVNIDGDVTNNKLSNLRWGFPKRLIGARRGT